MRIRLRYHALLLVLVLLLIGVAARGDIVTMKDGRTFEGKITSEKDDQVVIDTLVTGMRLNGFVLHRVDIASIEHQPLPPDFWESKGRSSARREGPSTTQVLAPLPPGPLKDSGLMRASEAIILSDEPALLEQYQSLADARHQAERESKDRQSLEMRLAAIRKTQDQDYKEWQSREARLPLIKDVTLYNNEVTRMNSLVAKDKKAHIDMKDLQDQLTKFSALGKAKYVDALVALSPKIDAAMLKYKKLAADPAVKGALAHLSPAAPLGPSAALAAAAADLQKWQDDVESEAIPLREHGGTYEVDALLNGQPFVLMVDTGASFVALSAEAAEKIGLHPSDKDPTVHMHIADGSTIECKVMTLDTVRVGRFTLSNVTCDISPKGLKDAPLLLGGSFLNHFIVKLEPGKKELHLTDLKDASASEN